jgi:UDP-glucose 4-epimerase
MRSLVTGGAGFIGSHLVDALLDQGDEVVVVDNLATGRRENLGGALERGGALRIDDITGDSLASVVASASPDRVFHLAAQADVRRAVSDPVLDATVNVAGTAAVLEAARVAGARLVFASTGGAIYGEGLDRDLPLSEREACYPDSPYGQSKLAAEGYLEYYRRVHGTAAIALRLGNVYGPRQDPLGEAGVIAIFCAELQRGGLPIVYGDGHQSRDFVYVADVVEAFLAADAALVERPEPSGPYNVGTGRETTVLELVERIRTIGDSPGFVSQLAPARPGEIQRIALDCSRAAAELGWKARTSLDHGLERTTSARGIARSPAQGSL